MSAFDPLDLRHLGLPVPAAADRAPADRVPAGARRPRVLFEEDFSPPGGAAGAAMAEAPQPEVIEPTYSAAELEDARRSAFRDGRDAGRTAARAEAAAAGEAALAAIAGQLREAAADARTAAQEAAEGALRLCVGMLAALHPSIADRLAAADIEAMVASLLPVLAGEPKLALRVCPPLAAKLQARIAAIAAASDFAGEIALRPDPSVAPGGATLSWSAGAALRDPAALRTALLGALRPLGLGPLTPETQDA